MLKLNLTSAGKRCRVELNGQDISGFLRAVRVSADVSEVTRATLEYQGAVVVEGDAGQIEFQQAEHCVRCDECRKVVAGEEQPVKVIDVTTVDADAKEYAAVTDATVI
jgi:hypothetical protein